MLVFAQSTAPKKSKNDKTTVNSIAPKAKNLQDKLQEATTFFADGLKAFALERYTEAIKHFQKAIELAPDQAAFHYKLAETYFRTNNPALAINSAKEAIELEKSNKFYYNLLAKVYISQQKYDEAIETYQNLIKNCPNTEEFYYEIADLQVKSKKWDEAIETYNKLEQKYGINETLTRQKQLIYIETKKNKKAIAEAEKLLQHAPLEPRYAINLAQLYVENKQNTQALIILEDLQKKGIADATTYITLAEIYRQQEKYTEALEHLKTAVQFPDLEPATKVNVMLDFLRNEKVANNPTYQKNITEILQHITQTHPNYAQGFVLYADFLLLQNQRKEANQYYWQSLLIDENNAEVWLRLLQLDDELGRVDSTLKHAERATTLFPNNPVFWLFYGTSLSNKKNYAQAIEALEEGKRLALSNQNLQKEFLVHLGEAYFYTQNYAESDKAYEDVLKINPNEDYVLNNYSYFLALRREKIEKAYEMAYQLYQKYPNVEAYVDTYAWVLYVRKEYKKARQVIEKIAENTKNGEIVEHYGDILFQLGEQDKAFEQWQRAKKLGKTSQFIDQKIANKKLYE
ncbi:MAG: tetratricopeptide repeat protein [Microscillaceae bacterium]|nr:tetratricopeptide repeat protein [Microscillaceae bacterium]MDW8460632.1 tetratricopeptide repeat protein [Cytophagales bacterium]